MACSGRCRKKPTDPWHVCGGHATHHTTKTEVKRAIRFSITNQGTEEHSFVENDKGKYVLCGD